MALYLNTYKIHEAYGGPEEGGWWFEVGHPVQSVKISDEDFEEWEEKVWEESKRVSALEYEGVELKGVYGWAKINQFTKKVNLEFTEGKAPTPVKNRYGGYSFLPGSDTPSTYERDNDYRTVIEEDFAESYPAERPYYE